jgi:cytochrome c oxidase subunit 2
VLPTQSAYDISVASSQWNFNFTYFVDSSKSARHSAPGDSSVLYLPEGKLIHFTLTSADTTHGFWIPGLSINSNMDPSVTGHLDFTPNKIGTFLGHCNVSSCGRGHAGMAFTVKVVSNADFLKYLLPLK